MERQAFEEKSPEVTCAAAEPNGQGNEDRLGGGFVIEAMLDLKHGRVTVTVDDKRFPSCW